MPTKWEYKKVIVSWKTYEQELNALGMSFWEAYAVLEGDNTRVEVHLKRPFIPTVQFLAEEDLNPH